MIRAVSLVLFFLSFGFSFSQDAVPLVFKGCETAENQENCSILQLAKIISSHLNSAILPYEVAENEDLTLSLRLAFYDDGSIRDNWSIIYNSVENSHEEFEPILTMIPVTLTAIKSKDENRLSSFSGFFTFKKINGRYKVTAVSNEAQEQFKIIEKVPIVKGCKPKWSNEKIVKCNNKKINTYFESNFKLENLDFKYYVEGEIISAKVYFFIETDRSISISKIEAPEETFTNEIRRVIENYKAIETPGLIGSKEVRVPYSLPIQLVYHK